MGRSLAHTLGWVAPSERFAKTIERSQTLAYNDGQQEVTVEHLFSAALEDLDAVYFLARFEIPLPELENEALKTALPPQNVPRLAPPVYLQTKVMTHPHLEIPASPALRRVIALASALAENLKLIELHGGLALEAILEDGQSHAAAKLKSIYETVRAATPRVPPLPGGSHKGARLAVQSPEYKQQAAPPPPRRVLGSPLEQVRWLKEQMARELEQEPTFRFIQQINVFAEKERPYASMPTMQLREEARADLAVNQVYLSGEELRNMEHVAQAIEMHVHQAALRIAEIKPEVFNRFVSQLSDAAGDALRSSAKARAEERDAMARMADQQNAQPSGEEQSPAHHFERENVNRRPMPHSPDGVIRFPRPAAQDAAASTIYQWNAVSDLSTGASGQQQRPKDVILNSTANGGGQIHGFRQKTFGRISKLFAAGTATAAGIVALFF